MSSSFCLRNDFIKSGECIVVNQQSNFGAGMFTPKLAPHHMAMIPPEKLMDIEKEYLEDIRGLWTNQNESVADPRFKSPAWQDPYGQMTAKIYLVNAKHLLKLADAVEADPKTQQRIRFATEQTVSAMSPANFLATNPDAIKQFMETKGQSLTQGILNMLGDLRKGKVSQTDEKAFEVGKNMATSEGAVVFQNELFQLIQYKPLTKQVYERPFLLVPPCINKYYILDLQPENSVVRHLVSEGHTVFLVSWKNPDQSMTQVTWDDYIGTGAIKAIEVVQAISKQKQINLLGFCVGGTIVTTALAVLAARNQHPIASLTLLTALLDFEDTGILDVFIDEAMVQLREKTIGGEAGNYGLMSGVDLANTFSFLRPNDLVWNYVVDNYLKGNTPPPFDLLYWNGDSTNLPGPMYAWYLRHMYLQNELKQPGKLVVCGEKLDLGKIKCPAYIYASREDHIVPWWSAYASTRLLKGKLRFMLGASGHIAGVINPPAKKKRNYWVNDNLPASADAWFKGAKEVPGSWWPDFTKWLSKHGGKLVSAPKVYGNSQFRVIEKAPGSYVKEKAVKV